MLTPQYAAGFFDGEGTLSLFYEARRVWKSDSSRLVRGTTLIVSVANTHLGILQEFKELFKGNVFVNNKARNPNHKPVHSWRIQNTEGKTHFLKTILPYSIVKREQIEIALRYLSTVGAIGKRVSQDDWEIRLDCYNLLKEINKRGRGQGHKVKIPETASTARSAAIEAWRSKKNHNSSTVRVSVPEPRTSEAKTV